MYLMCCNFVYKKLNLRSEYMSKGVVLSESCLKLSSEL